MKLSARMEMILEMAGRMAAAKGGSFRFVEPGCDHAYLSIGLLERGYAEAVYAMDIVEGPLKNARENIRRASIEAGKELHMTVRRSDGLAALAPGEADALLIAGMGAGTMLHILTAGSGLVRDMELLILQPQTELFRIRGYLTGIGFAIIDENMVLEDGKFYSVIAARPAKAPLAPLSREELCYGPVNLRKKNEILKLQLSRRLAVTEKILERLFGQETEEAGRRRGEILREREELAGILGTYW